MQIFVDLLYSNLYSSQEQANIQSYIINGDSAGLANLVMSTKILAPFLVIAIAFFIMFFVIICCCVFEKSCPPC